MTPIAFAATILACVLFLYKGVTLQVRKAVDLMTSMWQEIKWTKTITTQIIQHSIRTIGILLYLKLDYPQVCKHHLKHCIKGVYILITPTGGVDLG